MSGEDKRSLLMLESEDIIAIQEENQTLRAKIDDLRKTIALATAKLAVLDELHELLDLVMADGAICDLDQHQPNDTRSSLAMTLYQVLHRLQTAEAELRKTA